MAYNKERLKDLYGAMITGLIGTVIVLSLTFALYSIYQYTIPHLIEWCFPKIELGTINNEPVYFNVIGSAYKEGQMSGIKYDLALFWSNTIACVVNTFVLNKWYNKQFSYKRMLFNISAVWLSIVVFTMIKPLLYISVFRYIESEFWQVLLNQAVLGILQFVWGLCANIISYRKIK